MLLIEPVLDKTVVHTTRLYGNDKLCIVVDQLDVLHVVRDRVPGLPDIILAVERLHPAPGLLPDPHRAVDGCPVLLGMEVEPFPGHIGEDLEVLDEEVALVLRTELCPLPALGDVIHFSQC